ncbi:Xaa-Pro peptidase family protein [Isosphaeraceae bacterium EP7]
MADREAGRRERLRATWMATDVHVHALLITSETNVRYLTGFTGDATALLVLPGRVLAISDGRYTTQLSGECPDVEAHIRPIGQPLAAGIGEVAAKLGVQSLGFEPASLTVAQHRKLSENAPGIELVAVDGLVEGLRMVKDDAEIDEIRRAVDQAERAFLLFRAGLQVGQSEKDAADLLEGSLRCSGADGAAFPPIVAAGENAALPHARPSAERQVGPDEFVLVDWGASTRGYKSDLTRMVVIGKVWPKFEAVYGAVLKAQQRAIDAIRPGTTASEIDAVARGSLDGSGFGPAFTHGLGHGFGLDIHEEPRMNRESGVILQPGMVVTVEPGVYLPGWGGVRIEDDILIRPDGHEVLTSLPKSIDSTRL